jgi:hypothetical protein
MHVENPFIFAPRYSFCATRWGEALRWKRRNFFVRQDSHVSCSRFFLQQVKFGQIYSTETSVTWGWSAIFGGNIFMWPIRLTVYLLISRFLVLYVTVNWRHIGKTFTDLLWRVNCCTRINRT